MNCSFRNISIFFPFFLIVIIPIYASSLEDNIATYRLTQQIKSTPNLTVIDSIRVNLEKELFEATSDTAKASIMFQLGVHLWEIDSFKSEQYFLDAAKKLNTSSIKNSPLLGDVYRYLAALYTDKGRYTEAMVLFNKAKSLLENTRDSLGVSNIYHNISILHKYQGNKEDQKTNIQAAIAINEKLDFPESLGHNYKVLGEYYSDLNMPDSTLHYFAKSEHNFKKIEDSFGLFTLKGTIANFYLKQEEYQKSIDLYNECLEFFTERKILGFQSIYASKLASIYISLKNYPKALQYNNKSLKIALKEDYKQWISTGHLQNSIIQEKLQNYKLAYQSAKLHKQYSDSLFNKENVKKIQALELTYLFKKEKLRDSLLLVGERKIAEAEVKVLQTKNKVKLQGLIFGGLGFLIVFVIVYLHRTRQFANRKKEMQENFSRYLIEKQENERARISRELHDSIGQKLMLLTKKSKLNSDATFFELANSSLQEIRDISRGLHPSSIEKLGITKALKMLVDEFDANTDLFFTREIDTIDSLLSKEQELNLYRIVQETLNNLVKHSQSPNAYITVKKNIDIIDITIEDNGKGFVFSEQINNPNSLGMRTLLERAKIIKSKIKVTSSQGKGTLVHLTIPT